MITGILALQGCVEQHIRLIRQSGAQAIKVRSQSELESADRLILPGGESSTMLILLKRYGLWDKLKQFTETKPCWGICAGSILLAKEVLNPQQDCLAALPIRAHRNFYGSQLDSFNTQLEISGLKPTSEDPMFGTTSLNVDFIRAPKFEVLSKDCQVLAKHNSAAVLIRYKQILVSSFHTELRDSSELHRFFLGL